MQYFENIVDYQICHVMECFLCNQRRHRFIVATKFTQTQRPLCKLKHNETPDIPQYIYRRLLWLPAPAADAAVALAYVRIAHSDQFAFHNRAPSWLCFLASYYYTTCTTNICIYIRCTNKFAKVNEDILASTYFDFFYQHTFQFKSDTATLFCYFCRAYEKSFWKYIHKIYTFYKVDERFLKRPFIRKFKLTTVINIFWRYFDAYSSEWLSDLGFWLTSGKSRARIPDRDSGVVFLTMIHRNKVNIA